MEDRPKIRHKMGSTEQLTELKKSVKKVIAEVFSNDGPETQQEYGHAYYYGTAIITVLNSMDITNLDEDGVVVFKEGSLPEISYEKETVIWGEPGDRKHSDFKSIALSVQEYLIEGAKRQKSKKTYGKLTRFSDKELKEELVSRGWDVVCTRTKVEEL